MAPTAIENHCFEPPVMVCPGARQDFDQFFYLKLTVGEGDAAGVAMTRDVDVVERLVEYRIRELSLVGVG